MADLHPQMLLGRMAYRLSLLCLGIWTTLFALATAQTNNITPEIINFVPTCAQKCFESFITANFDVGICGSSPSLQCLCRQRGNSGYTIGEGAASCLVGESRFGACQGQDAIDGATSTGYNMCVGVSRAEPNTHSTIVATLILPSSGTGPLLVPTAIRSPIDAGPAISTVLAAPTPTVSLPAGNLPGFVPISPTGATTSTFRPIGTSTPDPEDEREELTSAQVAGITLGCAAVVVFGILLVLLARCVRKKRFGDLESGGFFKMRDSMSFGRKSRPASAPGLGPLQVSSPLPRVQTARDPADPRWHPQIPPRAVGLGLPPLAARGGVLARPSPTAASPHSASAPAVPPKSPASHTSKAPAVAAAVPVPPQAAFSQGMPKLVVIPAPEPEAPAVRQSPPKPTLTLAIPNSIPNSTPNKQKPIARVPATTRDSVVTEFAEDGEGDPTSATSVWRPPPTDPQSATTVYFADKGGNWILRKTSNENREPVAPRKAPEPPRPTIQEVPAAPVEVELPSPDHKTRAERAREAYGEFSPEALVSPLRLPRKPGHFRLGSPIAFKDQRREPQFSSPSLSARLSQSAETLGRQPGKSKNQSPDVHFPAMREARDLTGQSKRRSARRGSGRLSQGSVTSIESAADDEAAAKEDTQADLSPVAESPQTPISPGKSPVTYPQIHKRNDSYHKSPTAQGPGRDALPSGDRYNMWHPPGQSSATGSSQMPSTRTRTVTPAMPAQQNGPTRPWNAPSLRPAAPGRNPGQPRTGSPGPAQVLPIEAQYLQSQRQVANPASYWNQTGKQALPPRTRQPPPPTPPYELPGESPPAARRYNTPPPPQQHHQQLQYHHHNRRHMLPTPAATPQSQAESQSQSPPQPQSHPQHPPPPAASDTSSQGSLLAKRRGADKAAALMLNSGGGSGRDGRSGRGWTREDAPAQSAEEQQYQQHYQQYYQQHHRQQQRERQYQQQGRQGQQRQQRQQRRNDDDPRYGPVPITPGWVPELTPTRRGADLYLNVR